MYLCIKYIRVYVEIERNSYFAFYLRKEVLIRTLTGVGKGGPGAIRLAGDGVCCLVQGSCGHEGVAIIAGVSASKNLLLNIDPFPPKKDNEVKSPLIAIET